MDPTDPKWDNNEGMKNYPRLRSTSTCPASISPIPTICSAITQGMLLEQSDQAVRRRSVAREHHQAGQEPEGFVVLPTALPGIKINTSRDKINMSLRPRCGCSAGPARTGTSSAMCSTPRPSDGAAIQSAVDGSNRKKAEEGLVKGLMQNQPLLLSSLLKHADRFHSAVPRSSRARSRARSIVILTGMRRAARAKLADALRRRGVLPGDRGRNAGLEQLPALRDRTRRHRSRRGVARDQPAADSGPDLLHRQSCRRQGAVLRQLISARWSRSSPRNCRPSA